MTGSELLTSLDSAQANGIFLKLYGEAAVDTQRQRYTSLIKGLLRNEPDWFPDAEFPEIKGMIRVFSAPGRTELGGNHTDHNRGKVLAASIQMDSVAIVAPRNDKKVFYRSTGYPDVIVDLDDLSMRMGETGSTEALVRGIAAEFTARGTPVGGFTANADSTVLKGSGLSSSAAVEVIFCKIFDCIYGEGKRSALELAQIGQKAENNYFGKPCGLMDQTACASGGAVAIDFENNDAPKVSQIEFDPASAGYTLCVVDTGGSHADLTPDYAAIPREMKAVASFFGKSVLREIDDETVKGKLTELRKAVGDRAVIRAMHFFKENRKVDTMLAVLGDLNKAPDFAAKKIAMEAFLELVFASGNSSWKMLQNIYPSHDPEEQGIPLALAFTRDFFKRNCGGRGACRVHGGGFAGTIQVYLPKEALEDYRKQMEAVFGANSLTELRIRPVGATELLF